MNATYRWTVFWGLVATLLLGCGDDKKNTTTDTLDTADQGAFLFLAPELLGLPEGYRVGVVPASDTGAVEMALWSLLGARPVDVAEGRTNGADGFSVFLLCFGFGQADAGEFRICVGDPG